MPFDGVGRTPQRTVMPVFLVMVVMRARLIVLSSPTPRPRCVCVGVRCFCFVFSLVPPCKILVHLNPIL